MRIENNSLFRSYNFPPQTFDAPWRMQMTENICLVRDGQTNRQTIDIFKLKKEWKKVKIQTNKNFVSLTKRNKINRKVATDEMATGQK
jgi:hypothetical protein